MLWRVNTTHTMGVDVIDKTVEGEEGGSIDTKSLEWRGLFIHWRTCSWHGAHTKLYVFCFLGYYNFLLALMRTATVEMTGLVGLNSTTAPPLQ